VEKKEKKEKVLRSDGEDWIEVGRR